MASGDFTSQQTLYFHGTVVKKGRVCFGGMSPADWGIEATDTTQDDRVVFGAPCSDHVVSRKEVYHLNRELLREKTRCKALEEELENPMNVHRWRKLEVRTSNR